jgi:hypothetical protein
MMKTRIKACIAALIASSLLFGCASPLTKIASVTDRTQVDLSKGRQISASASGFQLLLLIPIGVNGRQESAYNELLAQAGDSVLADVKITESWKYAFVGTIYTTTIEATAYPRISASAK